MRGTQRVVASVLVGALMILPSTAVAAVDRDNAQSREVESAVAPVPFEATPDGGAPEEDSPALEESEGQTDLEAPAFGSTITQQIIDAAQENPDITVEEIAEILGFGEGGSLTLLEEEGLLSATVTFDSDPTREQVGELEVYARVRRVLTIEPVAMALVAPSQLKALGAVPGVISVEVNLAPQSAYMERDLSEQESQQLLAAVEKLQADEPSTSARVSGSQTRVACRTVPAVANAPLKVAQARQSWGVDGTGVTVGILSISYDMDDGSATRAVDDVRAGLLPGPGNPCGYQEPVQVLRDGTAAWYNDEGRAMAQIVHGIAPGARLLFIDVGQSPEETAQNIVDLRGAGADLIVDDIYWSNELNFQKGPVSQAIDRVKSQGVTYFSSSGNNNGVKRSPSSQPGVTGYPIGRHQSDTFIGTPCPQWLILPQGTSRSGVDCLDFSPNGAGQPLGRYTMGEQSPASISQVMHWSEPANGLKTRLQLQMYGTRAVTGSDGVVSQERCLGAVSSSDGAGLPVQYAQWDRSADSTCNPSRSVDFVVVRDISRSGYGAPTVQITPFAAGTGTLAWDREFYRTEGNNTIQGSQYGHNGDGSAASVAASAWTAPTVVQSYSSLGANQTRFGPSSRSGVAPTLPNYVNPEVPVLMGLDGIVNSFFGSPIRSGSHAGLYAFFGTSAASPTAAAVAALGLEKNPTLKHDQVISLMQQGANTQVANPYSEVPIPHGRTVGAGLIDADSFLNLVPQTVVSPVVSRLGGANRYATNVKVNESQAKLGAPVFIATGQVFADALSIGPAVASMGGSLFLTRTDGLSQDTLAKIVSLSPSRAYIVGGTGAVSPKVERQLRSALSGIQIKRVSGSDRYATSSAILKEFFSGRMVVKAFVATGMDYPDALSAAAAGGALGAPVLLVKGKSATALPSGMPPLLRQMGTTDLLIAGGTGAVNASLERNLRASFSVSRLSGADRYGTNMAVNDFLTGQMDSRTINQVWIATGRDFPDALSAAVPAGALNKRLVLSNGKCIPKPVVSSWIKGPSSRVSNVYLVGGPGALGPSIQSLTQCG